MPKKKRVLPEPPGRRAPLGGPEKEGLIFDGLQEALAGGKLEEFMKENIPEGKYARKLTEMMMGMSGLSMPEEKKEIPVEEGKSAETRPGGMEMKLPEDIFRAAHEGDVQTLSRLLMREQGKGKSAPPEKGRKGKKGPAVSPEGQPANTGEPKGGILMSGPGVSEEAGEQSLIEKEIIDSLFEISVDNGLQMDWLIQRALKLYVKKYRETGQL